MCACPENEEPEEKKKPSPLIKLGILQYTSGSLFERVRAEMKFGPLIAAGLPLLASSDDCVFRDAGVLGNHDVLAYEFLPAKADPVSSPVSGKPGHSVDYEGYNFRFVDNDSKKLFQKDPSRYVPSW